MSLTSHLEQDDIKHGLTDLLNEWVYYIGAQLICSAGRLGTIEEGFSGCSKTSQLKEMFQRIGSGIINWIGISMSLHLNKAEAARIDRKFQQPCQCGRNFYPLEILKPRIMEFIKIVVWRKCKLCIHIRSLPCPPLMC